MMNDLSQISGLFLLIIPKPIPVFHLHAQFRFSWFDYNLSFAHVPYDRVKTGSFRSDVQQKFIHNSSIIKNYNLSFTTIRVILVNKGKNAYYEKAQALTCTPNLEGYDPTCKNKNVYNKPWSPFLLYRKLKQSTFTKIKDIKQRKNMSRSYFQTKGLNVK